MVHGAWTQPPTYTLLLRARRLMDDCYGESLNVPRLASECGFSPYHFIREFRRVFGEPPHQYLARRRMERAKELLRAAEMPVTQICLDVGYRSLGSFSWAFSRYVGQSPAEYRLALARQVAERAAIPACFLTMYGPDRRN